MRYWRKRHEGLDLEAELRAGRPEPAAEFIHRLEARVRHDGRTTRGGSLRVAFVGALTAVMLLALASVGGVGYASSSVRDAVVSVKRVVAPKDVITVLNRGSALDQYGGPRTQQPRNRRAKKAKKRGRGARGRVRARTSPPFTG